jgi:hypothetical protein
MDRIDYRTDHRLADSLALQAFMLRHHLMRRALVLAAAMLIGVGLVTLTSGAPLRDSLADLSQNAGRYLAIFAVGLLAIHAIAMVLAWLAWRRRPLPREICAIVTGDGISLQKDGFTYGARWADADLLAESGSAFLMKFNQLYMRLPKRGFSPQQESLFRALAGASAPPAANRLAA